MQWQRQQTSQLEKDMPWGSGQDTQVSPHETPVGESKNNLEVRGGILGELEVHTDRKE